MTIESPSGSDTFAELLASLGPASQAGEREPWTMSLVVDFGAVDHQLTFATFRARDPELLRIDICRRDEYDLAVQPVTVVRGAVEISVAGFWFSAESCRDFARLLLTAANKVDSLAAR